MIKHTQDNRLYLGKLNYQDLRFLTQLIHLQIKIFNFQKIHKVFMLMTDSELESIEKFKNICINEIPIYSKIKVKQFNCLNEVEFVLNRVNAHVNFMVNDLDKILRKLTAIMLAVSSKKRPNKLPGSIKFPSIETNPLQIEVIDNE